MNPHREKATDIVLKWAQGKSIDVRVWDEKNGTSLLVDLIEEALSEYAERLKAADELENALRLIPCQKCESGDGIDYHEGAGCYKQEALAAWQKAKESK